MSPASVNFLLRRGLGLTIAACVLMANLSEGLGVEIVAVEEHWELQIGEPNEETCGPQITMIMSPTYDLQEDYFLLTLNHHLTSQFTPGGMQLQQWHRDAMVQTQLGPQEAKLKYVNETVSWVQRMSLDDGTLTCEIVDGTSQSWGSFGGQGHLRIATHSPYENLNDYHPAVSLLDSGVHYAGNRVSSLTLMLLRLWDADGNVYVYEAPIDVDTDIDP